MTPRTGPGRHTKKQTSTSTKDARCHIGIRQFIITLSSSQRTHTHQLPTPNQGSHQQTSHSTLPATPSPGQLFQPTRPIPQPATPKNSEPLRDPATPNTLPEPQRLKPKHSGAASQETRSPLPTIRPFQALPGRRRGSLTRHKLRTAVPVVKSPGQSGCDARCDDLGVQISQTVRSASRPRRCHGDRPERMIRPPMRPHPGLPGWVLESSGLSRLRQDRT